MMQTPPTLLRFLAVTALALALAGCATPRTAPPTAGLAAPVGQSVLRTMPANRAVEDRILAMNPEGLYDVVRRENISMCGYGPATAMLTAARMLGASKADLVKYATSADVSGDFDRVVGYAGMMVT